MDIDKSQFSFEAQHLIDLLLSDEWPEAVPEFLICKETEQDKFERAEGIVEYFSEDFKDKKVLDFGCGEGHLAAFLAKQTSKSIGYDIVRSGNLEWENDQQFLLTNMLSKVHDYAPYDYIFLYDVLDHCKDQIQLLALVRPFCGKDTKIFVRCHSWMSRHGGHMYKQINKAWVHLVFTSYEMEAMNFEVPYIYRYYFPINTQKSWFSVLSYKVHELDVIKSNVEPFFYKEEIMKRLPIDKFKNELPVWQMSQSFNDYILQV